MNFTGNGENCRSPLRYPRDPEWVILNVCDGTLTALDLATLYDHQDDAVEAIMDIYTPSPRSRRIRFRAQLHMAPGLGKTHVAARIAERVAGAGSLLMAVPTRQLLEQTHGVLRAAGRKGPVIAVYSPQAAALVDEPGVSVVTDPRLVARMVHSFRAAGQRQFTVLTTYASVEGSIIAGHALSAHEDGVAPLPEWDLLVTDESHRAETSKQWGRINDQSLVPALHRLAMTATPRLMGPVAPDGQGQLVSSPAVVLSERIHGPVAYVMGLGEAQRRGKLARSQVVVAEVDEERLRELVAARGRGDEGVRAELLAASLAAMLRAAGKFGCRRLLSYHATVAGALAAAESLAEQSRLLHAQGTSAPRRVCAVALHQDTPVRERRRAFEALAKGTDLGGRPVDLVVVCSVRILNEGIDVPSVDAVAIVDARRAQHELLQIAGRAVRLDRSNPGKTASIIVPVLHLERPADDTMEGPDWAPAINMLRAVESYEPAGKPASTASTSSGPRNSPSPEREYERREARAQELTQMLQLTRERSARVVADRLKITVVSDPASHDVERVMRAAVAYQTRCGDLRVPIDWEEEGVKLGWELDKLRRQRRKDLDELSVLQAQLGEREGQEVWRKRPHTVPEDLAAFLAEQGFVWEPRASARQTLLEAARVYAQRHGHLLPGIEETIDIEGHTVQIGKLLSECRRPRYGGTPGEAEVCAVLDALGVWQVPQEVSWNAGWQRKLVLLRAFHTQGGRRGDLLGGQRLFRGDDLGKWLLDQHRRWKELAEQQRSELTALKMGPADHDGRARRAPTVRRSRQERLMEIVAAAQRHLVEVGPLIKADGRHCVDDTYRPLIEGREVQLRRRLNAVRARFDTYSSEQQALFAELGLPWAQPAGDTDPCKTAKQDVSSGT